MDKLYHFISFAFVSTLLIIILTQTGRDKLVYVSLVWLIVFAVVSEFVQPFFGRVFDVGDIIANLGGVSFPFLIGAIWLYREILKDI